MRTKTDEALATAEREHAGDPERAELLSRARRFKASWIELAEGLVEVRKGGRWKRWGYSSFEDYTRSELHLKPETVDKLTGSFSFLSRKAPEVLRRDGVSEPLPTYQAIDFWRRAEQEGASDDTLREIRKGVLEDNASAPAIARKFKEVVFPIDADEKIARDTAQVRNAAKRLNELLDGTPVVSKRMATEVRAALEKLLESLSGEEAQAA